MKYYFKKHRIKIFFLLVLSLLVFGCSFLIKEVNVKQENEAGEMVAYIKAGEIATFTFSGEINIDGDASNETFIVGFLAPRSWNVRQNAIVTYREDRYETEVDHKRYELVSGIEKKIWCTRQCLERYGMDCI